MYTLDTNVIIYYLDSEESVVAFLKEQFAANVPLYVSTIAEHELYSYPHLTRQEAVRIARILDTLTLIDVDSRLAQISAELRRQHNIKALDSFIAATAMLTRTTLVTRNVRDFRQIPSLSVLEI